MLGTAYLPLGSSDEQTFVKDGDYSLFIHKVSLLIIFRYFVDLFILSQAISQLVLFLIVHHIDPLYCLEIFCMVIF